MNTRRFAKAEGSAVLAAGRYDYFLNDVLQPISESWQCFENGDGELVVDSTRLAGSLALRSRAISIGNSFDHVLIEWNAEESIKAFYHLSQQCCCWQSTGGNELRLPVSGAVIYPLMRVFTGAVIAQLAQLGGSGKVIIPDIRLQTSTEGKLQPHYSERSCAFVAEDEIYIQNRKQVSERWTFIGDQYSSDSCFWLDANRNLLCYSWSQGPEQLWRVERVELGDSTNNN